MAQPGRVSRSELLWVMGLFVVALALRESLWLGSGRLAGGCDEPFVQQVAPILQSGNPLHFESFFYPPVPAFIVAGFAGLWRTLGGGGDVSIQCGAIGLIFSLATVAIVYLLGRLWGQPHGLIAMAFYAVTMTAVTVQGNVQVYSTFFLALAMYGVLQAAKSGEMASLVTAGVWLGLGVASKYSPLFFSGVLFIPYVLRRWMSREVVDRAAPTGARATNATLLARVWTGTAWVVVSVTLVFLWVSLMQRETVYGLLRHIYEQRSHENPFEYHLPWIDRLYRAGLVGVGLVGLTGGLALLVPWVRHVSAWEWARSFFTRNRLWVSPCAALLLTVAITVGLPAALNLNDFTRHFVHIAKGRGSGDNGFFPEHRPAPSYIGAYIPESTGLPLFIAGLVGILYPAVRRDKTAALLIASAIPAYLILELNRVKVNRYALELLLFWCLLAAIWLGDICQQRRKAWRLAALAMVVGIVVSSAAYTLAWAEFNSSRPTVQTEAGNWLRTAVPPGTSLGVKSALLVTGSPELLPDATALAPYRLVDYTEHPEYVLLPNGVHAIVVQYLEGLQKGYVYNANDWFPSEPTPADLDALSRIVREEGYALVTEFRKRPVLFGVDVGSHSLTGRTWMAEHSATVGIRIYRRVPPDR